MRKWITTGSALLLLALSGCAHVAPGTVDSSKPAQASKEPCSGGPTVMVEPELTSRGEDLSAAWLLYGMTKIKQLLEEPSADGLGHADDFASEVYARNALAEQWETSRKEGAPADPYLDQLVAIKKAGVLREYILTTQGSPGWTLSTDDLKTLNSQAFLTWSSTPRDKIAIETHTFVCGQGIQARAISPDDELAFPKGFNPADACQSMSEIEALARRVAELEASSSTRFYALEDDRVGQSDLDWLVAHRDEYPRGVTFVSTKAPISYFLYGYCLNEKDKPGDAEVALRKSLALRPRDPHARSELATSLTQLKRFDEALVEARTVADTTSSRCAKALAIRRQGFILFEQGKLEEAFATYQASLTLDPNSEIARRELVTLALELARTGRPDPSTGKAYEPPPSGPLVKTRCEE